jgi:transcriptional regulator with XRE-family HTH domain
MDVYDRINNLLRSNGMSRAKLAKEAGINVGSLHTAFSRRATLNADMIAKISSVLDVSVNFLLYGANEAVNIENKRVHKKIEIGKAITQLGELYGWSFDESTFDAAVITDPNGKVVRLDSKDDLDAFYRELRACMEDGYKTAVARAVYDSKTGGANGTNGTNGTNP